MSELIRVEREAGPTLRLDRQGQEEGPARWATSRWLERPAV
ncbi:hypothetical protein ACPA9J_28400 [Pseudomonas aeruginosa]